MTSGAAYEFTAPETDDGPPVVVEGNVEVASDAVVAEVTVGAHGAWALVLIDGNDDEEELELEGTLKVGVVCGVGIVVVVGGAVVDDALKGDGVAAGVTAAGGGIWALTLVVASRNTMPTTDPRRRQRCEGACVDRFGIIAGDP